MKHLICAFVFLSTSYTTLRAQDVPATAEETVALLLGNWNWQYTVGSFLIDTFTVADFGPGTLSFGAVSAPESVSFVATGAVGSYIGSSMVQANPIGWRVYITGGFPWYITTLNNTTLHFYDEASVVDGPITHHFTRALPDCAQLNPTITGNLLINCAYETSVLSTQTYEGYQWYRRGYFDAVAQPIAGATAQTYTATIDDVLYYFSVEVTQDTCSATSPEVLIDQLVGLPPYVVNGGTFTIDLNGNAIVCPGDTLWLEAFGIAQMQWYSNGSPIGTLNQNPLPVTESGYYTVLGVDPICPLYPTSLGVEIPVIAGLRPQIDFWNEVGLQVTNPYPFTAYQWYYDGLPLDGATDYYIPSWEFGTYWVVTTDVNGCTAQSEPIEILDVGLGNAEGNGAVLLYPNPANETLHITGLQNQDGDMVSLYDLSGRCMLQTVLQNSGGTIHIGQIPEGLYLCRVSTKGGTLRLQQKVAVIK